MHALENDIKTLVIETLNLEDISSDEIDPEAPLFNEGLGLDSIDALELGVAIKKRYNITLESDDESVRKHFQSIRSLAAFISANQK